MIMSSVVASHVSETEKTMSRFSVERYVETDTGHRVPNHKSKCRVLHGHRYRFTAKVSGELVDTPGDSSEGMVIDFSDISRILNEEVHDVVDHCTVLWRFDTLITCVNLRKEDCGGRLLIVDFIPTAENFAKWAYDRLKAPIEAVHTTLRLESVSVRETPKSIASYPSILPVNRVL